MNKFTTILNDKKNTELEITNIQNALNEKLKSYIKEAKDFHYFYVMVCGDDCLEDLRCFVKKDGNYYDFLIEDISYWMLRDMSEDEKLSLITPVIQEAERQASITPAGEYIEHRFYIDRSNDVSDIFDNLILTEKEIVIHNHPMDIPEVVIRENRGSKTCAFKKDGEIMTIEYYLNDGKWDEFGVNPIKKVLPCIDLENDIAAIERLFDYVETNCVDSQRAIL